MTERAEQVVLDYLSRVGDAAYGRMPQRRRAAFLSDLRSRITAACSAAGADTPEQVRRVLNGFGAPEELVARENASAANGVAGGRRSGAGNRAGGAEPRVSLAEEEDGSGVDASRRPRRPPPPWRGGPDHGWLGPNAGLRDRDTDASGTTGAADDGADGAATRGGGDTAASDGPGTGGALVGAVPRLVTAARRHPAEMVAVGVYLASGALGQIAFVWAVGGVLVALSRVLTRTDKLVAVGLPVLLTVGGMAAWPGDAPYVDQIILESLLSTGVIGLRVGALAGAVYLVVRLTRTAPSAVD